MLRVNQEVYEVRIFRIYQKLLIKNSRVAYLFNEIYF